MKKVGVIRSCLGSLMTHSPSCLGLRLSEVPKNEMILLPELGHMSPIKLFSWMRVQWIVVPPIATEHGQSKVEEHLARSFSAVGGGKRCLITWLLVNMCYI